MVRVSTKVDSSGMPIRLHLTQGINCWTSNGRLESDLLDQLADLLASRHTEERLNNNPREMSKDSTKNSQVDSSVLDLPVGSERAAGYRQQKRRRQVAQGPTTSTPTISGAYAYPQLLLSLPKISGSGPGFASPSEQRSSDQHLADAKNSQIPPAQASLQAEAASLEEVLKNQARPKNLVAVKKSGTPVVGLRV